MMQLGSGGCEETKAFEKELEYLRAIRAQQPDMAQDALIAQKNHHIKAAKRYYKGWLELIAYNGGQEIGTECPELEQEFDQIVWLAGIINGLQSLNHDILSGIGTGVPKNIAAQAERGAGCLDNKQWFVQYNRERFQVVGSVSESGWSRLICSVKRHASE